MIVERKAKKETPDGRWVRSLEMAAEMGAPKWLRKPKATKAVDVVMEAVDIVAWVEDASVQACLTEPCDNDIRHVKCASLGYQIRGYRVGIGSDSDK